jgi:hypothetical protein
MRRLVIGGLVAAVGALSMACAQAIKTVETVPGKGGREAPTVHTMSLVFHDPAFGGCKLLEKPGRIRASKKGRDVVVWQIANHCDDRIDVCLVGFFPEQSPLPTTPDPLEEIDDQNNPQPRRRCDRINAGGTGRIRTRVRSDAVEDEYEYNIRLRRQGHAWKTVDPMIDIVP